VEGLLVLLVLGVLGMIILPIIALVRSMRIDELIARVERLEQEIRRLRREHHEPRTAEDIADVEVVESGQPSSREEVQAAGPADAPALPAPPVPSRAPRPRPVPQPIDAAALESWIGQKALGWAAVVVLLFATGFFLKYSFENGWIGPLGRVSLGATSGALLCVGGLLVHRRGRPLTAQMLTAGGVAVLYLSTFGAFGYYQLLPRERAGLFFTAIVIEAAALAVLYEAPAIAVMAVVGGLLSPILLHADHDQYRSLFLYLTLLDAGVVGLALFRRWLFLAPIALLGTHGLFWIWYFSHYHPEKFTAALVFQIAMLVLFIWHDFNIPVVRRQCAGIIQLIQVPAAAFLFALAGRVLMEDDRLWLPVAAIGLALVYLDLTLMVQRILPEDRWLQFVGIAVALSFVASAIALRGEAAWISLGWAVEGAILWWFAQRIRAEPLRWLGAALLVLGAGRLVLVDTPWMGRTDFVPVFNRYALPALAVAVCLLLAAHASRRFGADSAGKFPAESIDQAAWVLAGLGGVLLIWLVLSLETYQYAIFHRRVSWIEPDDRWRFAQSALSVVWAVYASVVLAVGFWRGSMPLRGTALGLFGLTLGKVFLVDMAGLPGFYRVVAFFALAVLMGAGAWIYQRIEASPSVPGPLSHGGEREREQRGIVS
jgi:uncharacterized membrane protein